MIDVRLRLFKMLGDQRILNMSPKECALVVVNNLLADANGRVSNEFLNFMAEFLNRFYAQECATAPLLAHIAMARISCETMMFENEKQSSWINALKNDYGYDFDDRCPSSYKKILNFDSIISYPGLLNQACADFILKQGEFILSKGGYTEKKHMKKILFTLVNDYAEDDLYESTFVVHSVDGKALSEFAKATLYRFCEFDELIGEIAQKNVYKKHLDFIRKNWHCINKKKFADAIGLKGLFKKLRLHNLIFQK